MEQSKIEAMAESLRQLIARGGRQALSDERRVRGKLLDDHGTELAAIDILVQALKLGVPDRLVENDPALIAAVLKRETERLQIRQGIERSLAAAAVRTWALALGIALPGLAPQEPTPAQKPARPTWVFVLAAAIVVVAAPVAYLLLKPVPPVPPPPPPTPTPAPVPAVEFSPADPLTWPLAAKGTDYAVVWRRRPDEGCPAGWPASTFGCVHAAFDLGTLTPNASRRAPVPTPLYFSVEAKPIGGCSLLADFSSDRYCLSEAPFPTETSVALTPEGLKGCGAFLQKVDAQPYCLWPALSPALRGPWHTVGHGTWSTFMPPSLQVTPARIVCSPPAVLGNDVGFCLTP